MSDNPNNCLMCDHKSHPDGGWCYMFKREPTELCMQHTGRGSSIPDHIKAQFNPYDLNDVAKFLRKWSKP